jgi:putative flavoprotein involved in K+ transport
VADQARPAPQASRITHRTAHPGSRGDHSWIEVPGAVADGSIIHTRGITPADGLYVLGMPWQHTRGSALLGFVNDDATWLADRIAVRVRHGHLAGPGSVPSLRC